MSNLDLLRQEIAEFLQVELAPADIEFELLAEEDKGDYKRQLISYQGSEGDEIKAYLLIPEQVSASVPGVLVHHQHNGERHLGKSEVCGLAGDPLQAFGPELASKGVVVLAPDSICFEDRRRNKSGLEPAASEAEDWLQHYNEMCYRLVTGDLLMKKVLEDAGRGLSLLAEHPLVNKNKLGIAGHSYGGNTVLFQGALDQRVKFACSSGAACSYQTKMKQETGIEMAEVIPGFAAQFEITDLVKCFAPRRLLLMSATEDKYSQDAGEIFTSAQNAFTNLGAGEQLSYKEYEGGHALTKERFQFIINWLLANC